MISGIGNLAEDAPEVVDSGPRLNRKDSGEGFTKAWGKLPQVLKLLGYKAMRPGQDRAVMSLMMGMDTLSILPTGSGKSAIYIIPTLCRGWRCVIFSPLVALMHDQLNSLLRFNLPAAQISSGQTPVENNMALRLWEAGDLQFLLVSPERQNDEGFMSVMRKRKPNLVTLDEAHCASQWGNNFRPAYSRLGQFVGRFNPEVVLAITATATMDVESDIRRIMGIPTAHKVVYYPSRENLLLSSRAYQDDRDIKQWIDKSDGSTIVYCLTRAHCEELYARIGHQINGGSLVYHGGMDDSSRTSNQELFMSNRIRVMFCTNAFGLGVDKPDIRNVFHRDVPASVEAYTQESGRAGRDGKPSQCVLFCDPQSLSTVRWMIDQEFPERRVIEQVFHYLNRVKDSNKMVVQTIKQVAEATGISERLVGSVMGTLDAAQVVQRSKEDESPAKVRLIKDSHENAKLQIYLDTVKRIGFEVGGALEFKLSTFVDQTRIKISKVKETFKLLDKNGYLQYSAPFAGKSTKVIGDLSLVDFDRLRMFYRDRLQKLKDMERYMDCPDEDKHDFLQAYFFPKSKV